MSYETLRRELKQGVARNLYLFYGPEDYLKRHYTGELEKLIVEPIAKDVSINVFEGKPDPGAIYDACMAYPFFGGRRLVVLKNCGLFKQSSTSRRNANDTDAETETATETSVTSTGTSAAPSNQSFKQPSGKTKRDLSAAGSLNALVDDLPEFTSLLIVEDEVDKRLSLFKHISEKGLAVEFLYRTPAELEDWARAIAGQDGKKFTREALKYLVAFSSGAMTELRSELDKLLMYTADKPGITLQDINAVCIISLKVKIFGLLNNVIAGNKRQAYIELDLLLKEREPVMRIIAALSNHFVLLGQIKRLAGQGVKLSDTAKITGINPYRAEILWRQCANVSSDMIDRMIALCREQDAAIKSGVIGDEAALRLLVMSISK